MHAESPALIALDWGTSSLRAWLLNMQGQILDARTAPQGIRQVRQGNFAAAYRQTVGDWGDNHPELAALASGMIGSRNGWREAAYIGCPADLAVLADSLTGVEQTAPRLSLVPGIMQRRQPGHDVLPDVIRGEETQVLGALALEPALADEALLVLPGTHSKWVEVRDGRVTAFSTYMTGELFAVLRDHSILGEQAAVDSESSDDAFMAGLAAARASGSAGVARTLFSARSGVLAGDLAAAHSLDYLSGLLIGDELRSVTASRGPLPAVRLIGDPALCRRYRSAFDYFEVADVESVDDAAVAGLWRIATAAGLLAA